jgi:signal transduction histidine kinase
MKKSIFHRTFSIILILITVSFVTFGAVCMTLVYQYATSEKEKILQSDAQKVAQLIALLNENYSSGLEQVAMGTIALITQNNDTNIIVTDIQGKVVYCTDTMVTSGVVQIIRQDIINQVILSEGHTLVGTLGGVYNSTVYTVALPITGERGITGFVFVSSSTTYLKELTANLWKILLNAALFVMFLTFVVCYFLSKKLTQPLKEMSQAANDFAKGKFDHLLKVSSQDEIGELSMALNNMANDLSKAESARSSFIANVSHDLKTPMTTISGFIDGILDGTIPKEKEDYYLKIVADEVRRLSRMVKGLLDVARFEENKMVLNYTKFDLCAVIGTILVGFEQNIKEKNIYVEVYFKEPEMMVYADYDMSFQVVYNLIDNAVKFANRNGIITIRVEYEGKKVRCTIRNTGEGIAQKDIGQIFERFYKTDSSRGLDKQGVGLGLYLVRSIISAHKETIDVNSMEGEFCEFSFTLPTQEKKKDI